MFCWGDNFYGQLGDGTTANRPAPTEVRYGSGYLSDAIALVAGMRHTCGLLAGGNVVCWGWNLSGQLGDGTTMDRHVATDVAGLPANVVDITAGSGHTCAVLANGGVWCWGRNAERQLGLGDIIDRLVPTQMPSFSDAISVASRTGADHTCALRVDGLVWCWGSNQFGQLGVGNTDTQTIPVQVPAVNLSNVRALTVGAQHSCALIADGSMKCWGRNTDGRLGDGTQDDRVSPTAVTGLSALTIRAIGTGASHTCVLASTGYNTERAYCWGQNTDGQIGDGTSGNHRAVPTVASGFASNGAISGGGRHTCAVSLSGTTHCWGLNATGQVGDGTTMPRPTPTTTPLLGVVHSGPNIAAGGGAGHSCLVNSAGNAFCWGSNAYGQLGNDSTADRNVPTQTSAAFTNFAQVSPGGYHTCAMLVDHTAACWGYNGYGELGTGDTLNRDSPTDVSGLLSFAGLDIRAGEFHTCALLSDRTVHCWGNNSYGQLGDGTRTSRASPGPVSGLSDAIAVAAGAYHTCALRVGGSVVCWGLNAYGEIGNNGTADALTPTSPWPLSAAGVAIAAGAYHTCALLVSGGVQCWGYNSSGQIGDNTCCTNRLTPTSVVGLGNASAIVSGSGSYHTCALGGDGAARCWGYNANGQIGDGTNSNRWAPTSVAYLYFVSRISTGSLHSCALEANGTAWCWGRNANGQLGSGNSLDSVFPVQIGGQP